MGNKTGKFNVPSTEVKKDENGVVEPDIQVATNGSIEANGDHVDSETPANGDAAPKEAEPKKKNIISWFKKVSIRKEKKPKVPKENGVKEETKEENGEVAVTDATTVEPVTEKFEETTPAEQNGPVEEAQTSETPAEEVKMNGHHEEPVVADEQPEEAIKDD